MRGWLWGGLLFFATVAPAAEMSSHLLAFAVDNRMTMALGKYDPVHGWMQSTEFYTPPEPGDVFTLYSTGGAMAQVTMTARRRAFQAGTFASWDAAVSHWNNTAAPFVLAVAGKTPFPNESLEPIAFDNPDVQGVVSRYLKSKGLHVDAPYLTQAMKVPLSDPDRQETVLVAHSDAKALTKEREAAVYAVALIWWMDHGKESVVPLASQTSYKPAGRSVEEHEHLYGTRDYLRVLCAVDIDGDGWKDFVLYRAKDDATQIDVFTFDGHKTREVLSAYKPNYN